MHARVDAGVKTAYWAVTYYAINYCTVNGHADMPTEHVLFNRSVFSEKGKLEKGPLSGLI